MEYLTREIEGKFLEMNGKFKVVMLTGARQVGKTAMLRRLAEHEGRTCVSLDDSEKMKQAAGNPGKFLKSNCPPVFIDGIHEAPNLLEAIREICDKTGGNGLFWLACPEDRNFIEMAGKILKGHVCILRLLGLSQREKKGLTALGPMDFSLEALDSRTKNCDEPNSKWIFDHIRRGGLPMAFDMNEKDLGKYYSSYIENYIVKDALKEGEQTNPEVFRKMLSACAAYVGNILKYSVLARAAGVSPPTAAKYVHLLESMGIVYLLEPYFYNEQKRTVQVPKLYFYDTGLAAYLGSNDGLVLENYFENYVVIEILKSFNSHSPDSKMFFYQDCNQYVIDVVLETEKELHLLDIKLADNSTRKEIKKYKGFDKGHKPIGRGGVISMTKCVAPLDRNNAKIPCNLI